MNSRSTIFKQFMCLMVALACLTCLSSRVLGQTGRVSAYTISTFNSAFSSISGTGTYIGNGDDSYFPFLMPFSFNYDNTSFTGGTSSYCACDNGKLYVGVTTAGSCYGSYLGSANAANAICVFAYDMYVYGGIYYLTTGSAPNRVLTVEFNNIQPYPSGNSTNMQIKLYEGTNVIEMYYANNSYAMTGGGAGVGLNGTTSPSFTSLSYQSLTTTPATQVRFSPPIIAFSELAVSNPLSKSYNFGSVNSGNSVQNCSITVNNVGTSAPLVFNSVSISGNPDFSISGPTPTSIPVGGSAMICVTFTPLASGGRSATLNLSTNGRDSGSQSISLSGIGVAPSVSYSATTLFKKTRTRLGTSLSQSFLVSSTGLGPVNFSSITIQGQYAGEYSVTRFPANPLGQGLTDTVTVTYSPTIEGSRPAFLVLRSNALNNPVDSIGLFGVGTLPRLTVTPSPLNFDSVPIGTQQCMDVTLKNPGTDTIYITHNFLSSFDADYTMTPITGTDTILPPDRSRTIHICFTPIRSGSRQARLRITTTIPRTFEQPSRDTSSFTVDIIGQGVPFGRLAIGGSAIVDSGIVGKQICRTDTFYNTGSADVTITGATITGADSSDYALSGVTFPIVVSSGGSKVFTLCVTPAQRGDRTASLNLTATTSGKSITAILPLDIFGQLACASAIPGSAFTRKTCVGTTDTAIVTVTNCGDVSSAYTAALPQGTTTYAIVGSTTSTVVGANGKATFPVVFTPTDRSSQNVTLTITGNNGVSQTVTLTGSGQAATAAGNGNADSTKIGRSSNGNLKINNTGECDWNPGTPTFSDPEFTYVSGSANIPAGQSGTLVVKFTPTSAGLHTATLSFPSAIGTSIPAANVTISGIGATILGVAHLTEANGYSLAQNYPNPFNPITEIRFVVAKEGNVTMKIIDVTGKVVHTVFNEHMTAGQHSTVVNASELASGAYYYQLVAGNTVLTRQMVLAK
jgi:hypothetical protein